MAKISHCTLVIDGKKITAFSKFKENEIEYKQTVQTMDGDAVIDVPKKYGFSLTYLPDKGGEEEWDDSKDGATCIVQYTGGKKVTFTGCSVLKATPNEIDGSTGKEVVIEWHAEGRKVS